MMPRMRLALALVLALLAALLAAAAAAAATLTTDARCYAQGAPLKMTASGLTPDAPLTVALNGQALRYRDGSLPRADASGGFASTFSTPALLPGVTQRRHLLSVDDGTREARARFTVTRPPGADFTPSHGNPSTLRARFVVWGFALDSGRNARAWLHWISPRRTVRKTALLGLTRGLRIAHDGPAARVPVRGRAGPVDARDRHAPQIPGADRRRTREDHGARPPDLALTPMRPRSLIPLVAAALASAALAPATAGAARITLDPACYLSSGTGLLTGSGFRPRARWTAKLSGTKEIGTGRIDRDGAIRARFTAPVYRGTKGTREYTLSVTDGSRVASTTFLMSPLDASFAPRTGDPATLRVRWRVLGLGPRHGVYVHYVTPRGRHKRTVRIGTTRGACGSLKTGPIALFPFRYSFGTWTFQVDASSRYDRDTTPRLLLAFDIRRPASAG
jgi:hypothetical protein